MLVLSPMVELPYAMPTDEGFEAFPQNARMLPKVPANLSGQRHA